MTTIAPYRSEARPGQGGFGQLVRAEWTKFATVPGWGIGILVAVGVTVLVGLLGPLGSSMNCSGPNGQACKPSAPPIGPDGEAVTDSFYFVHQPLTGDGSITARVTSLTGSYPTNGTAPVGQGPGAGMTSGTEPWSKAGIIVKQNMTQGSAYAAVTVTGSHGVRMQYDYTHDQAGQAGAQWLRLTRSGTTLTGYDSVDGTHWTAIGTANLAGLTPTIQIGLFAASPDHTVITQSFGGTSTRGGPSVATGHFTDVAVQGTAGTWTGTAMSGEPGGGDPAAGYQRDGNGFTVTGSGDIAPALPGQGSGRTIGNALVGVFAGLIAVIVVATLFVTAEYRRGLIRTTFAASPRRGRVLAAKSVVAGSVAFVAGLVAATAAVAAATTLERAKGFYVFPVLPSTELRVVVGVAALLAVTAVLAVAVGILFRRGAGAVTVGIVAIVLPYVLSVASVLPSGAAEWLMRLTPAAAFAIEQSVPRYPQVVANYTPGAGYFPLAPWAGFAVLCGYTVLALVLATVALRRRDA